MSNYDKCLTCNKLPETCIPNLMGMETQELGLWCNELRKHKPWMTYDWIANETGVSKSAVHGFLTAAHTDYRRETFRPIVQCIIGGKWMDDPCGNVTTNEKAAYEAEIKRLENELAHRDEKIADLKESNASMQTLITNTNARLTKDKDFLREQIKIRNKAIGVLSAFLFICLAVIIGALIIDRLDPTKGFIWLRSFLGGEAGKWWFFKG